MNADAPDPGLVDELQAEVRRAEFALECEPGPVDPASRVSPTSLKLQRRRKGPALREGVAPHVSRTFRVSSTLAGLAAGLALIAYGEGLFNATPVEPAPIMSVPPAKIVDMSASKLSEPAASATRPRRPSPRSATATKRPAISKRSTSAETAGTTVGAASHLEKPRRRNFLGLRSVADWISGRSKTRRPGEPRKAGGSGKPKPGEAGR